MLRGRSASPAFAVRPNGPAPKLGIVAGGGDLPAQVIDACQKNGRPFYVVALRGQADHPMIETVPHTFVRLGEARRVEKIAQAERIEEVVLAGWVRRPSLRAIRPDGRALRFLMKAGFRALGDDSLLSAIIKEIEATGYRVVGVHDVVENLLAPEGQYGKYGPDDQAWRDIRRGLDVVLGLGELDVGQAVAVQQGIVLAVEAIEGTDAMIRRAGELQRAGVKGILVKIPKTGQERRVDLPTIGVKTIEEVAAAGLRGVAVEAGGALAIDLPALTALADKKRIFVVGMKVDR